MKKLLVWFLLCASAYPDTHYVDLNSLNPMTPYTNWATAAVNIMDAVMVSASNDTILVESGWYLMNNIDRKEIIITRPLRVESVNGPELTIIDGGGMWECFNLGNVECVISGFTIANGYKGATEHGGGVYCSGYIPVITNCILTGNRAYYGGGMSRGRAYDCVFTNNFADEGGGAAMDLRAWNCIFVDNSSDGDGGALLGGLLDNCLLEMNYCSGNGGAMDMGSATNCTFRGNMSLSGSGGGLFVSTAIGCKIYNNSAWISGGGVYYGNVYNSTIVDNYAVQYGGGVYNGSVYNCTIVDNYAELNGSGVAFGQVFNSIIYNISTPPDENIITNTLVSYSCSPLLRSGAFGSITNVPNFIDSSSDNYRLSEGSMCINSGWNAQIATTTDADGNPRIVNGTVDMGAYEVQTSNTIVNLPLRVILEQSSDLQTWTYAGKYIDWLVPADSSNGFYRTRLEL